MSRATAVLGPVLLAALLTGCPGGLFAGNRTMGEECDDSQQCADDGTCLAGVCEGYACETAVDCDNDHSCATVAGVMVCALPCEASEDCAGTQSCVSQEDGSYCL